MDTATRRDEINAYDFIVCGSGSSGSVLARCLADNADVRVLLLEVAKPETPWLPASLWASAPAQTLQTVRAH